MSGEQTIHRLFDGAFTTLSNKPLQDKRLSLEARGLIASVMSLPKDWVFNRAWAQKEFSVGRDKLDRIIGELKQADYIRFIQKRSEHGKLGKGAYYIAADPRSFDNLEPLPDFQYSGADRDTGLPDAAKPVPANKDTYKRKQLTKELDSQSADAQISKSLKAAEERQPPAEPLPPDKREEMHKTMKDFSASLRMSQAGLPPPRRRRA